MNFKYIALALMSLGLSACTQAEITTPPVAVTPTVKANAVGLDVYARDRSRGNPVPRFRGQKTVPVRAFGKDEKGNRAELSGVECKLDAGVYRATVITPANVNVPDYGPSSPALFVRCVAGERSGSVTLNAYNATNEARHAGAAGGGILGAIIVGAIAASKRDDSKDDFQYRPASVTLK